MRLPRMIRPSAETAVIPIPFMPEITLPAPAAVPPIVLPAEF